MMRNRTRDERIYAALYKEGSSYTSIYAAAIGSALLLSAGYIIAFGWVSLDPIQAFGLAGILSLLSILVANGLAILRADERAKESINIEPY